MVATEPMRGLTPFDLFSTSLEHVVIPPAGKPSPKQNPQKQKCQDRNAEHRANGAKQQKILRARRLVQSGISVIERLLLIVHERRPRAG